MPKQEEIVHTVGHVLQKRHRPLRKTCVCPAVGAKHRNP